MDRASNLQIPVWRPEFDTSPRLSLAVTQPPTKGGADGRLEWMVSCLGGGWYSLWAYGALGYILFSCRMCTGDQTQPQVGKHKAPNFSPPPPTVPTLHYALLSLLLSCFAVDWGEDKIKATAAISSLLAPRQIGPLSKRGPHLSSPRRVLKLPHRPQIRPMDRPLSQTRPSSLCSGWKGRNWAI